MKRNFIFAVLLGLASAATHAQVPDNSFGLNGRVTAPTTGTARAIALQPDGKLVTAGISYTLIDYQFQLFRFNSDGSLDNGFGTGGTVTTTVSFLSEARAVIIQPDGKILVGGIYHTGDFANVYHMVLARYNADGTPDSSFGVNGLAKPEPAFSEELTDMVLQPDGKILVGGAIPANPPTGLESFMVARFNSNGTLDNSFGSGGITSTVINMTSKANKVLLLPDGKIMAAGYSGLYEPSPSVPDYMDFTLARYTAQGALDQSFGINGIVTTNVLQDEPDFIQTALLQPDGKIVAAGTRGQYHCLVRYLADGSLDNTFGINGKLIRESWPGTLRIARRSNGNLVTSVHIIRDATSDFMVNGYTLSGTIDSAFGDNGSVLTDFASSIPETYDDLSQCIIMQPDGKMTVAGSSNGKAAVVRYNLDTGTGIEETGNNTPDIEVHPNPVGNVLNLDNKEASATINITLSLRDITGRLVFEKETKLQRGRNTFTIPNLVPGNYILSGITDKGAKLVKKVTKK